VRAGEVAELVDLDQVGVAESGQRAGLLLEALTLLRVGQVGVAQQFDRHVAAQRRLAGLPDHAHAARAQHPQELQTGDVRRGAGRADPPLLPAPEVEGGRRCRVGGVWTRTQTPFSNSLVSTIRILTTRPVAWCILIGKDREKVLDLTR
jgi:hypothetical protein